MEASARTLRAKGRRIGYVHVWCYAGYGYQQELEHLLSEGPLRDADALIGDLRDGWGSAVPEYLDLFDTRALTMQMTDRNGASEFADVKWRKPVAMLVKGFTKYWFREVIATRTEGAVGFPHQRSAAVGCG
jgi:carboxyl-terminal processing protease